MQDQVYIRQHVQNYYAGLGLDVKIPDFEPYITMFRAAHQESVTEFVSPDIAPPAPELGPSGNVTQFDRSKAYVVAAITPLGKSVLR